MKARVAVSGNWKVGMPARFRISLAAATSAPPMKQASTGFPVECA